MRWTRLWLGHQGHFFHALTEARLVPAGAGWKALKYSRCGRTDKGVSALGQVRLFAVGFYEGWSPPLSSSRCCMKQDCIHKAQCPEVDALSLAIG